MKEYFKKSQRFVALVLTVLVAFTMMPVNSFAATTTRGTAWDDSSDRDMAQATRKITWSGSVRATVDGGAVASTLTAKLAGDTFSVKGKTLSTSAYAVSGTPSGLKAVVSVDTTGRIATVKFTGKATTSARKDITNFAIAFKDTAFTGKKAATVTGYKKTGVPITFVAVSKLYIPTPTTAIVAGAKKAVAVYGINMGSTVSVKLYDAAGKVVPTTGATIAKAKGYTSAKIVYDITTKSTLKAGTYTVKAFIGTTAKKTGTFKVVAPAATYTVKYDANGGTGTITDATKYKKGATVTVKAHTGLTYEGHTFAGWNTKADGTGTPVAATFAISSNVTLYAIWDKVAAPTVTKVEVTPETATIAADGGTKQFTAKVTGTNSPAETVKWSISGTELNALTTINETTGLLTVNAADAGKTITVTATSTVDTTKSGTATVTVEAVAVAKFTVSGTVTSTEEPTGIVGVTVKLVKDSTTLEATTTAGGAFSIANVNAAEGYKLEVKHTGYNDYTSATAFNVTADTTQNVVLVKAAALTSIDKVAFGTVTAPVFGATPATTYTPADTTANYTGAVTWAPVAATFAADTEYVATLTLTAKAGYKFKDGFAATDIQSFPATGAVFTPSADNGATVKIAITYAKLVNVTTVSSVVATAATSNNALTVMMSDNLTVIPTSKDFVVKAAINGGTETTIAIADADVNFALSNLKQVVINVPLVKATNAAQSVVYTVSYKTTTPQSATFSVAALDAVTISSIMVKNAYTIDVTLSTAFVGLTASDFEVKSGATSTTTTSVKAVSAAAPNATSTVYTLTVADIAVEQYVTVAAKGSNLVASSVTSQYRKSLEVSDNGVSMESDTMIKVVLPNPPAAALTTADISRFTVKFTQTLPTKATEVEIIPTSLYHFSGETNVRLAIPSLNGKAGMLTVNGKASTGLAAPAVSTDANVDFIAPIAELVAPVAGAQASLVVKFDSVIATASQKTVQSELLTSLSYNGSALTPTSIFWATDGKSVTIYISSTIFAIGLPVVVEFKDVLLDKATPGNKLAALRLQTVVVDTPTSDVSFSGVNGPGNIGGGINKEVTKKVDYADRAAMSIVATKTDKQTLAISNVTGVAASKVVLSAVIASGTKQEITIDGTEVAALGGDIKFDLTATETGKSPVTYKFTITVDESAATEFTTVSVTKPTLNVPTVTAPKTANVTIAPVLNADRADIKLSLGKKTTQTVTITGGANSSLTTLGGATSTAQEIVVNGTSLGTAGGNIVFDVTVKEAGLRDAKQTITITVDALKGLAKGTYTVVASAELVAVAGNIFIAPTTGLISVVPASGTAALATYDSAAKLNGYTELVALFGSNGVTTGDKINIDETGKVNVVTVANPIKDRTLDLTNKVATNCILDLTGNNTYVLTVVGNIGSGDVKVNGSAPNVNLTGLITTGLVDTATAATTTPIVKIANNIKFKVANGVATTVNGLVINAGTSQQFTFKDNKFTTVGAATTTYTFNAASTLTSGIQAPTTIEFYGAQQGGALTVVGNKTHKLSFVTATLANAATFAITGAAGATGEVGSVVEIGDNFTGAATLNDTTVKVAMRGVTLQAAVATETAASNATMTQSVSDEGTTVTLAGQKFTLPSDTTSTIGANTKLEVSASDKLVDLSVNGTLNVANGGILALAKNNNSDKGALAILNKGVVKVLTGGSLKISEGATAAGDGSDVTIANGGTLDVYSATLLGGDKGSIWAGKGSTFKVGSDYFTSNVLNDSPYFTPVLDKTVFQYTVNPTVAGRLFNISDVDTGVTTPVTLNRELLIPVNKMLEIRSAAGLKLATGVKLTGTAGTTNIPASKITIVAGAAKITGAGAEAITGNFYEKGAAITAKSVNCGGSGTTYTWNQALGNGAGGWEAGA